MVQNWEKSLLRLYVVTLSLFSLYAVWNAMLDEAQAEIMTVWRNINNLRYADDSTIMA